MDVAEANKFINALVKNLQVLCHGHVNFNNSIQVIGHLYLNVDSDTNIDYIVNEKVCKSDSSSTVFVSKSYHSEPKTPLKATQVDKRTEQNVIPVSLPSLSQPISNRRPVPLRITSKNIHPAYRDDRPTFESPAKIPKLSLVGEFKASRTSTPIQPKSKGGAEIDMCIVKQEPGMEREREDLQSPDHSNVPGPSFERLSDDFNPNDQSYSNSIPIALHGNNSNIDTVFSQSLDTGTSTAPPSQFGPIDGSSLDDNLKHWKYSTKKQIASALRSRRYRERKRARLEGRVYEEKVIPKKKVKDTTAKKGQSESKVKIYPAQSPKKLVKDLPVKNIKLDSKSEQKLSHPLDMEVTDQEVENTPSVSKEEKSTRKSPRLTNEGKKSHVKKVKCVSKEENKLSQSGNLELKKSPEKNVVQSRSKVEIVPIRFSVKNVRDLCVNKVLSESKEKKTPAQVLRVKQTPIKIQESISPDKEKPKLFVKVKAKGIELKSSEKSCPNQEIKESTIEKDQSESVENNNGTKSSTVEVKVSPSVKNVQSNSSQKNDASLFSSSMLKVKDTPMINSQSKSPDKRNSNQFSKKKGKDSLIDNSQLESEGENNSNQTSKKGGMKSLTKNINHNMSDVKSVSSDAQVKKDATLFSKSLLENTQSKLKEKIDSAQLSRKEREESSIENTQSMSIMKSGLNESSTHDEIKDLHSLIDKPDQKEEINLALSSSSVTEMEKSSTENIAQESLENNTSILSGKKIRIRIIAEPAEDMTVKPKTLKTELEEAQDINRAKNRLRQQKYRKKKKLKNESLKKSD